MKVLSIRITCFFLSLVAVAGLRAQEITCPSIDCGNLNVNFSNEGEVVFCEGSTITLINLSPPGFDQFIIEWGDGTIDTLNNYDNPTHQYDIPDSLVCESPQTSFSLMFTGIAFCDEGNSCQSGSYVFGIKPEPLAAFITDPGICINTEFTPTDASCHADTYLWDFGDGTTSTEMEPTHQYDSLGTYTITQIVGNSCGLDTFFNVVTVVGEPEAIIDSIPDVICLNSVLDLNGTSNAFSFTFWGIEPDGDENWSFTDTLMTVFDEDISVLFEQIGDYTITLTSSNICDEVVEEVEITVAEAPEVTLTPPPPACDESVLTAADLNFDVEGVYDSISWSFINGSPSTGSGTNFGQVTFTQDGTIQLTVEGQCGTQIQSIDVEVSQSMPITIVQPPQYCSGSSPELLSASPAGGAWSGTGVSADGVFDPSVGAGTYTLTYQLDNPPCNDEEQVTVVVVASETVTTSDRLFCEDSPQEVLDASPPGGSWSGMGIVDPAAGIFDPSVSGAGTFNPVYTYTDANGCEVTGVPEITVEALPQITLPNSITLCLTDTDVDLPDVTNISAIPGGGDFFWSGPGLIDSNGTFNPVTENLDTGFYSLVVTYSRNACTVMDSLVVELTEEELLSIPPLMPVCIAQNTELLTANLQPGTWSGPGVNANTGLVDLAAAGGGVHLYTYVYAGGTSCEQTDTVSLEVIDLGNVVSAGSAEAACEGPATYTLSGGSPSGGTWSGPGLVDPATGLIDLSQLAPGQSYSYDYCVESGQVSGCAACATKTLTYNPKPEAGFTFDGTPCINSTFTLLPTQAGLNYEWDFGDGSSSTAESPTYTYTDSATYILTQIVRTDENCTDTASQELFITQPPTAAFELVEAEGCAPFELQLNNNSYGDNISQQWCINGDTIDGGAPPVYVFDSLTDDTFFPIVLKVTNLCGTHLDSASVLVRPYPLVNFGLEEDEGCSPLTTAVNNISLGNPDNYFWRLGPDSTSTAFEPELPLFSTPADSVSVYTIELIATNECGADTLAKEVTVYPPDVEAFIEMDTLEGCQPFTIFPQSFSTPGSILSWEVLGPDGQATGAGNIAQPEFVLPDTGWYTIILYAGRCGEDTDTTRIYVLPAPELAFTHELAVCLGDTIRFRNNSGQVGDSRWDFGDGNSSNNYSPVHIFDTAGIFTVTYTAQSLVNNCPATVSSEVEVYGQPQSAFSPPVMAGCPPLEVAFENQSTGSSNLGFTWYFDDGTNPSLEVSPVHLFEQTGTYRVKLVAFDEAGCYSDTARAMITVHPEPISAFVLSQESYCLGYDTIRVEDRSVGGASLEWTIGGQPYPMPAPVVVPDAPGQFTAQLVVANTFGCRDTSGRAYEVLPSPAAAFSTMPDSICAGGSIAFQNQSEFSDNFRWDFGDGTGATESNPILRYDSPGLFTVRLTAASGNGCPADTAIQAVSIHPNPMASFAIERSFVCGTPLEAVFNNTSTGNLQNQWSFGDGGTSNALEPVYTYELAGAYQATLVTINEFGCRDTAAQLVDVYGKPVAAATASLQFACAGTAVTLTAEPTDAVRYEWYLLPNLQPDTGLVATYAPEAPGDYSIRLIAIYNTQCRDTLDLTDALTVFEQPVARFSFVVDELESVIGDVQFINESENATDFFWDLGDGNTSTAFELTHEYGLNGEVTVELIASTTNGGRFFCADTLAQIVVPEPIGSFEVPDALSPDYGDPAVREFGAVGSGVEEYFLRVYSPFGALIWSTDELEDGSPTGRWDGTYQNEPVPQGAYTWEAWVKFDNGEEGFRRGSVTVLR